ncbi:MAG TPA: acyl-CoA dehydrogenase family protein [Ilumatobacteraceae bacterium]
MQLVAAADLNDDQRTVQEWAHEFAEEVIRPTAAANDQERRQPLDVLKAASEVGLLTLAIPIEFGGGGVASALTQAIVAEELCWGCIGVYSYFSGTNMFIAALGECGSHAQQQRWLAPLCDGGPHTAAFACTEPGGGSDVSSIRTTAKRVDGGFVLNGQKIFITNAGLAQSLLIVADAKDGDEPLGLTMFAVRGDAAGLGYGARARTMGWRASTNAEVFIDDVFVADADVIGDVGTGFANAVRTFELSRIEVAACSIGVARAALEYARDYANQREAFGRSIARFQGVSFPMADAVTRLHASRLLTWDAARSADRGEPFGVKASMAKLFASEAALATTSQALQVLGGHGYVEDHPVEKWFRDARLETIEEGTSEIQRVIIGRALLDSTCALF